MRTVIAETSRSGYCILSAHEICRNGDCACHCHTDAWAFVIPSEVPAGE